MEFFIKARKPQAKAMAELIQFGELTYYSLTGIENAQAIAQLRSTTQLKLPDTIILHTARENKTILLTRDQDLYRQGKSHCSIQWVGEEL
jgi:predicted nucleic acid-binding protein